MHNWLKISAKFNGRIPADARFGQTGSKFDTLVLTNFADTSDLAQKRSLDMTELFVKASL